MYTFNYEEEQDIKLLVQQFEQMTKTDAVGFLEKRNWERLLEYYEASDTPEKVMEVANYAIAQHPYTAIFYIKKAHFLVDNDQLILGLDCLAQAEIFAPSELEIYLTKAEIYSSQKQYSKALQILEERESLTSSQDMDEIYLAYANIYEDKEEYGKAFDFLKKTLAINPKCESALERMWLCAEMSERYQVSIDLHNKILDEDSYSYWAWYNLGHALLCLERFAEAAEAFEFAFTIKEDFWIAYRECGEALMYLERYKEAVFCYESALKMSSSLFDIHVNIGQCYEALGFYRKARKHYYESLHLSPNSGLSYFRVGECFTQEEKWVKAIKAYQNAIKLEPENELYLLGKAEAYCELKDYEYAEEVYKQAITVAPHNQDTWLDYLTFLVFLEEFQQAFTIIEEAEKYSDDIELKYCKAGVYYLAAYRKEAFNQLQYLFLQYPGTEKLLFDLFPQLDGDANILALLVDSRNGLME